MRYWSARIGSCVAFAVIGTVFGAAGSVAQGYQPGGYPVGLTLGTIACLALMLAVRLLSPDRWAVVAAGLGLITSVLVISGPGPGGSVIVAASAIGAVWLYAVLVIVLVVLFWPAIRARPATEPVSPDRVP